MSQERITMKYIKTLAFICAMIMTTPAAAEPVDRWWSGWGMGVSEYGWSGSDGSSIYITCDSENNLGLSVAIRGKSPKPETDVIFKLNGHEVSFWATATGEIEMQSRVSMNNLYFLFDELKASDKLELSFDDRTKTFPLKGSAKGLGSALCE